MNKMDGWSSSGPMASVEELTGRRITFYSIDIRDKKKLSAAFRENKIDAVIHWRYRGLLRGHEQGKQSVRMENRCSMRRFVKILVIENPQQPQGRRPIRRSGIQIACWLERYSVLLIHSVSFSRSDTNFLFGINSGIFNFLGKPFR